ncbi:ThiF family adenylyltransferase [Pseudomonas viridiflava]|uniref:ThiF family adenylyltransferase n=1 Tax=Pseudomonas viridiflava TaxID=33069 RepID=UPI000F03E7F0|nr:ThiF family adenylyltransferase [Pseudomonas viridiflava]MEE3923520.1 ThiF family adenylyltransferase [Pseudomonas viridiflava]MEE3930156.1 ThiF family adenylyltransferase [Pseudomonas viridiflava]MEE3940372.1 ThiF family adenylyltransferase [Pseudomonas viridiflava]MEE3966393.1 ThiF family adenylyltransferase [Pseudomonas viridiflava]MEE3980513.1 ThiF family adenylyltransferase [Pseudomonas viridiflava]
MIANTSLVFAEAVHAALREHLFPGDGLEASALLFCARLEGSRTKLLVKEWIPVPYEACKVRLVNAITWPGEYLERAIDLAEKESLTIILTHSHPGGFLEFSQVDDESDAISVRALCQAIEGAHGSAIMVDSGEMRARLYDSLMVPSLIDLVTVVGHDIRYWWADSGPERPPMAFTSKMSKYLARLVVAVVGVSGTGSIVAEQVARLGFGQVILIDHDHVELKNLNRILNSTVEDAIAKAPKTEMFAQAITRMRGENVAVSINDSLATRRAVLAAAGADVIFSCVDTKEARMIADRLAAAFLIPLFDVGVTIPTYKAVDGHDAIIDVAGRIDYVRPGGPTLEERGVYTPGSLQAEYLLRVNKDAHEEQVDLGYFKGVQEEAPSVITLNMRAASACVSEFIARAFPFREEPNSNYARTRFSLSGCDEDYCREDTWPIHANPLLAAGCSEPLLGIPSLGRRQSSAA